MGSNEKLDIKRVIILAGAVIAFTIGSGFATGQEIIQYFTAYGTGGILAMLTFLVAFLYYNFNFAKAGAENRFERGNDIYKFYCGKYIGTVFDYYSTLFCYMSFFVMVGGAASTLNQQYGLPSWVGGVLLAALAILTVVGGLNSLVDKIGIVGPAIVILCIAIGVITLVRDGGNIGAGLEIIKAGAYEGSSAGNTIKNAGANWLLSGISYAGFVLLWFASFTTALGSTNKKKDLYHGIVWGAVAVCVAIVCVSFAQIANINTAAYNGANYVWNADIPNLILAERIWRPLASLYAIVVFAGIYTTAVPLLYNPASRFFKEGTAQFKIGTIVLGLAGLFVGLFLPFRVLVNVLYVINGYAGALLILFMLYKNFKDLAAKKKA